MIPIIYYDVNLCTYFSQAPMLAVVKGLMKISKFKSGISNTVKISPCIYF